MENPRMKVLHVLVRLDYGGIETWLINVLRNYDRDKFQMDVCLIGRRGEIGVLGGKATDTGSSLYVIPLRNPIQFVKKFKELAANYDVVLTHTGIHISPFVLFPAYLGGVKRRAIMLHSTHNAIPIRGLEKIHQGLLLSLSTFLFNKLNKIMATDILGCSMAALDQNYPGWRKDHRAQTQYLGIDLEKFARAAGGSHLRESLGIPSNALVLGHIGRFSQQKNHHNFIRVAKYLSAINPNIHFLLVGDGPLRAEIESQIVSANLQKRFSLTGVRDDVPDLMKIMDLAYFPSLHEGFPMTFIEAQVSGLIIVTAAGAEMREAICPQNQEWCITEINEVHKSGDRILYLLSNLELRGQLAISAQNWALERFSIRKSTQSLENILIQSSEGTSFV